MELFKAEPATNLLPYDGIVNYYGPIFGTVESEHYYQRLLRDIQWRHDEAGMFGKRITTRREVAWYGQEPYSYTYSNTTKTALLFTDLLLDLRGQVQMHSHSSFNSCLLNLYHDGAEGMAWHSDDEKELGRDTTIASLSFGAARKFSFKHKITGQTVSLHLESGSLLVMKGSTQSHWLHALPKMARIKQPRVNLTFRTIRTEI